jgi:ABC-type polysaccharide/polyol phosphate export permease
MFQQSSFRQTSLGAAVTIAELIYHSIVRNIRKTHGNAIIAILMNMLQAVVFVVAFYVMFTVLGLRSAALRGDFLLYIMSGIFLFLTHTKTLGAVVGSEGPASPMMKHAPLNTIISIAAAALGTLYIQVLSLAVILFIYHAVFNPVVIDQPIPAFGMLLIAWFTGLAIGVVLLALKPWFPTFVSIFTTVYQRVNMIASGKMFVANTLPAFMLSLFDWNPLFHAIDQSRGFVFLNYTPRYTSYEYAIIAGLVLLMIGLMGEFYTRRHASASWSARR